MTGIAIAGPYQYPPSVISPPNGLTDSFPLAIAPLPDATGDGVVDLLATDTGVVHLFSGANRHLVRSFNNPSTDSQNSFGASIAGIGDVNGDGFGDVLIGAPDTSHAAKRGNAYLFSGATGQLLQTYQSADNTGATFHSFGATIAPISDLDGDGRPDVLISSAMDRYNSDLANYQGAIYAFSSDTGLQLLKILQDPADVAATTGAFGWALDTMPDWNGDGKPEIIIGDPTDIADGHGVIGGIVYIVSARSGAPMLKIISDRAVVMNEWGFGSSVAYLGESYVDGSREIAVGAPREPAIGNAKGSVHLLHLVTTDSGTSITRSVLRSPETYSSEFGSGLAHVPDADGDGIADLAVAAKSPSTLRSGEQSGRVHLFSGQDGSLMQSFNLSESFSVNSMVVSIAGLASIDGDPLGDLAIGLGGSVNDATAQGFVHIYTTAVRKAVMQHFSLYK